ncbi:HTH-type transcriptional regulator CdhR [Bremerella volcania]|uniref:HTH-type transcriptional regulator CdhR n=1 Tax=Bremerella volcania TaxID=2527984 RepID=A0A518C976_9BACT|nr:helix-turn-helix domain-containing protein [Bremerella volcania]QDU75770.1 HTH-type transcriptional regulator CdhR [Bremerella volcania]
MNPRTKLLKAVTSESNRSVDVGLLAELFDNTTDMAFFVKDAEGRYIAVNDSLVQRHGWREKSDVIGKRSSEICEGDLGRIPSQQDQRVLRTGKALLNQLEMQWYRPPVMTWCLTTKLPMRDAEGTIVGLIGFSKDVRTQVEPEEIPASFADALAEFEQDLSPEVTPVWFAEKCQLSARRLATLTKKVFDLTPGQFIAKVRIDAATRLLRETNLSVSEIAHQCGFYDHSAFTRAFRKATGTTPRSFRQLAR